MASRLANLQTELGTSSTAVETLQLKSSGKQVWHSCCQQNVDWGVMCAWLECKVCSDRPVSLTLPADVSCASRAPAAMSQCVWQVLGAACSPQVAGASCATAHGQSTVCLCCRLH